MSRENPHRTQWHIHAILEEILVRKTSESLFLESSIKNQAMVTKT